MKRRILLLAAAILAMLGIVNCILSFMTGFLLYLTVPVGAINLILAFVFLYQALRGRGTPAARPAPPRPPAQSGPASPEAPALPEEERPALPAQAEAPPPRQIVCTRWSGKYRYIFEGVEIDRDGCAPLDVWVDAHKPLALAADPADTRGVNVLQGQHLLGRLPPGQIRDLALEYREKNMGIYATVAAWDEETGALAANLMFAHPQGAAKTFLLGGDSRDRVWQTVPPQYEGQAVRIAYDQDKEKYCALDSAGRLLGFFPAYVYQYMPQDKSRLSRVEAVVDSVVSVSRRKSVVHVAIKIESA